MNKVIIITGASRGIGRAIAKLLAENNYQVIANYNKAVYYPLSILEKKIKESKRTLFFKKLNWTIKTNNKRKWQTKPYNK